MATMTTREERGQAIAQANGQVKRIDETTYRVKSQSHNGEYTVSKLGDEWVCDCPDNKYRHVICKHIYAVDFSVSLRKEVQANRVIQEVNVSILPILRFKQPQKRRHTQKQNRKHSKILLPRMPTLLHHKHWL